MQARGWIRRSRVLLPLLALVVWSCEHADRRDLGPVDGPRAEVVQSLDGGQYQLIEGQLPPDLGALKVSQLIGVSGGSISLAGHTLTVPAGAVSGLALFTLTLGTDGHVDVDLKATATPSGMAVDVGKRGFAQPVVLTLTYAWATNVSDPGKLVILRMPGEAGGHGGVHEALPSTVDAAARTVTVRLDHFSGYCMAEG